MELTTKINEAFGMEIAPLNTYSPQALAFIGDGVFEIVIRTLVLEYANRQANSLHKSKTKIVNAGTQARIIEAILPDLTEEEAGVFRRGKNAKVMSPAKNADIKDYHKATGFEALCGYLYLKGDLDRLLELIKLGTERVGVIFGGQQ